MDRTTVAATMAANLRALADLLDSVDLPHLPAVTTASSYDGAVTVDWYLKHDEDTLDGQRAAAAAIIRAIGGKWDKITGTYAAFVYRQNREGIRLDVNVTREAVCERVVTGTRVVVHPAVEAQPKWAETVEDVEWRCLPLLTEAAS